MGSTGCHILSVVKDDDGSKYRVWEACGLAAWLGGPRPRPKRSRPPGAGLSPRSRRTSCRWVRSRTRWGRCRAGGGLTVALMFEFPAVLAGNSVVLTLVMVAVSPTPMLWQLTMAWKSATGLVPRSEGGTGGWSARTRPRTFTRR